MINIVTDTGIEFIKLSLLGLDTSVLSDDSVNKVLLINRNTGVPENCVVVQEKEHIKDRGFHLRLGKEKLYGFGIITEDQEDLLITCFYTNLRTHYMVSIKGSVFSFYVSDISSNVTEAMFAMFVSNLDRGYKSYDKTNTLIPNFFSKVFTRLFSNDKFTITEFNINGKENGKIPATLYYCRDDSSRNTLSLGGTCIGFNFDEYPGRAISNARWLHQANAEKAKKDSLKETSFGKGVVSREGESLADLLSQLNIRKERPAVLERGRNTR